jgi:hypothetical protein
LLSEKGVVMTQTKMNLASSRLSKKYIAEFAEEVGLTLKDEVITLSFIEDAKWGRHTHQISIDKKLAARLSRLINDELDDSKWY